MERETVLWRIGYAGCSEGPYRLTEVFERLKERRWGGEVLVYARGRTEGWVSMESVPEFNAMVAELRKTYMGPAGGLQWKASEDRHERGVDHEVWTEEQSQVSMVSQTDTWVKGGIELQEQSFGFLQSTKPPDTPAPDPMHEAFLSSQPRIAPAPVPLMKPPPPKRQGGLVPEGTKLPGFHTGFQVQVPQSPTPGSNQPASKPISSFTMETALPPGSPVTRIVTAPPSHPGIEVHEDGLSAFLPAGNMPPVSLENRPLPSASQTNQSVAAPVPQALVVQSAPVGNYATRILDSRPSLPGIDVREEGHSAFLPAGTIMSPKPASEPPGASIPRAVPVQQVIVPETPPSNTSYSTRFLDSPPSIPGIEVSEEGIDAFLN